VDFSALIDDDDDDWGWVRDDEWIGFLIHTCILHVLFHSFNYKGCFKEEVEIVIFSHTPL
jgi:hypothetical protein